MVAEVRTDGTVLAARALKVTSQANTGTSGGMERNVAQTSVRFVEVAELLVNAAGFAASGRGMARRIGEDLRVWSKTKRRARQSQLADRLRGTASAGEDATGLRDWASART